MSKELLDALESKLVSAVETIESLRREVDELREERRAMEEKLRGLIGRIDQAGSEAAAQPEAAPAPSGEAESPDSPFGASTPYRHAGSDF